MHPPCRSCDQRRVRSVGWESVNLMNYIIKNLIANLNLTWSRHRPARKNTLGSMYDMTATFSLCSLYTQDMEPGLDAEMTTGLVGNANLRSESGNTTNRAPLESLSWLRYINYNWLWIVVVIHEKSTLACTDQQYLGTCLSKRKTWQLSYPRHAS
jgi:hypothetical protein